MGQYHVSVTHKYNSCSKKTTLYRTRCEISVSNSLLCTQIYYFWQRTPTRLCKSATSHLAVTPVIYSLFLDTTFIWQHAT